MKDSKKDCPYYSLPESSFWKDSVAGRSPSDIISYADTTLSLTEQTLIGSAGSCFAQHISKVLQERGYNYLVCERAPSYLSPEIAKKYGYGDFSARYGNIYTPLQLLQLVETVFGGFCSTDRFWEDESGRFYDLLRPRIVPRGFSSRAEMEADLEQHLAAVKELFLKMDVFIFTLGLTEAWRSRQDGTVYPTCPGCGSAGTYDSEKYYFTNFSAGETTQHLQAAIGKLLEVNPKLQIILTVSPVSLLATMEPRHVLEASVYSKSVLRVTAEEMRVRFKNVHYFASYELITATCQTNSFFEEDRRSVTRNGVESVMAVFFKQFAGGGLEQPSPTMPLTPPPKTVTSVEQPVCDEAEFFLAVARKKEERL